MNRVVITGLGVVSSVGQSTQDYWASLIAGRSTFAPPTLGTAAQATSKLVGEVKDFEPTAHFESSQLSLLDRVSQFAIVAARQAVSQSGLGLRGEIAERTAAIIGTGSGGHTTVDDSFHRLYAGGAARLHPLTIPKAMISAPASQVSMDCGIKGPVFSVSSACASATHAIGQAFHMRLGTERNDQDVSGNVLAWVVVWFVLGYALYAMAYGALGSLASRTEDAQSVAGP